MTESSDHSSGPEDEDVSRPVASLAEVRVRRRRSRMVELEPEQPKPGDLTSILEKRSSDAEASATEDEPAADDEIDSSEPIDLSLLQIDQPADDAPEPGADIPPATEPPPSGGGEPADPTSIQGGPMENEAPPSDPAEDELDTLRLTREQARDFAGLERDPPAAEENEADAEADSKDSTAPSATISIRKQAALPPEETAENPPAEPDWDTAGEEPAPAITVPSIRKKAALPPEEAAENPPAQPDWDAAGEEPAPAEETVEAPPAEPESDTAGEDPASVATEQSISEAAPTPTEQTAEIQPAEPESDTAGEEPAPAAAGQSISETEPTPTEQTAENPPAELDSDATGEEPAPAAAGQPIIETAALPPEETAENPPAKPETESIEGEEESPAPAPSIRRNAGESGRKKDKARSSKKNENEEDVLRKRMAAIVKSGSKRREQAAARKTNAEPPAVPAPPQAPPRQAAARPNDIFRYWTAHRKGQALPALSALDLDDVARNWPDSLLLRFAAGTRHLELEMSFSRNAMARGDEPNTPERRIDYTPALVEWVLSQGLTAAKDGTPARVTEEFETETGIRRYSMVALPLSEDGANVDHILCHLQSD